MAAEDETDVEGGTGVANGAGNREGGCVGRDEQDSGSSKNRGKHYGQSRLYVDFLGILWVLCNDCDEARSGGVDTESEELRTTHRGALCTGR